MPSRYRQLEPLCRLLVGALSLNVQHRWLENYPALKARIGRHIEETKQQANLIHGCLDRRELASQ
jgi:ferritin-like metal-binding protein YciE